MTISMKTITASFKIILSKQIELGYYMPEILNPPAAEQEIAAVEDLLDIKFNEELKELYAIANGIYNDYKTPSGLTGLIPIHNFLSIADAVQYYKNGIEIEECFTNYEHHFKPGVKLFPFLEDGAGNCYWVDLNSGTRNEGQIFWTNTFGQDPDYLYHSLTNLFYTIAEGYEVGLFSLDAEHYLSLDYDQFDKLSARHNPELLYWQDK